MRSHIRQLASVYRCRFQMKASQWNSLIEQGCITQTARVYRTVGAKTTVKAQSWVLNLEGRHWRCSKLGHGWYEIQQPRDLDPLVDRGAEMKLVAAMAKVRGLIEPTVEAECPRAVGEPVHRDRSRLMQALHRQADFAASPEAVLVAAGVGRHSHPQHQQIPKPGKKRKRGRSQEQHRPPSNQQMAGLLARFGK